MVKTTDIEVAIQALKRGDCVTLDGRDAGWEDAELYRIIQCLYDGCGMNLKHLRLSGNSFSPGAQSLLCYIIGPRAAPAIAAAAAPTVSNPQFF